MFLLRIPGWADRSFHNRDDANTAGDFIYCINGDKFIVQEVHTLNEVEVPSAVIDLIRTVKGAHVISCIKAVRSLTGAGLKESKDFVDAL
jgi:hypothetical protein